MSAILEWIDSGKLSENPEIYSRNLFAQRYQNQSVDELLLHYVYLNFEEMVCFLRYFCSDLHLHLSGKGIELGAGCSAVSNALMRIFPEITLIYTLEIVPDIVRLLQPKVAALTGNQGRCIPVIGSFDEIHLPDQSLDFVVEFDAFHHSRNLDTTLKESARVLKAGGTLLIIDRVHHDTLPETQKEYLLSIEYPESFKKTHGMPIETKLTRHDNGEHEIRRSEWIAALEKAGFELESHIFYHRRTWKGLCRMLIALIPFSWRQKIGKGLQLVRPPLGFFMFYTLPFLPAVWRHRYRPLKVVFQGPAAFQGKSVIVAKRV